MVVFSSSHRKRFSWSHPRLLRWCERGCLASVHGIGRIKDHLPTSVPWLFQLWKGQDFSRFFRKEAANFQVGCPILPYFPHRYVRNTSWKTAPRCAILNRSGMPWEITGRKKLGMAPCLSWARSPKQVGRCYPKKRFRCWTWIPPYSICFAKPI